MPLPYVIKLGKDLTSELDILLVINHSYHVYFSIYVASLLLSFEQPPLLVREGEASSSDLASLLNQHAEWEDKYKTKAQDLAGAFSVPWVPVYPSICFERHCTHIPRPPHCLHPIIDVFRKYIPIHTIFSFPSSHSGQTTPPALSPPPPAPTLRDVPLQRRPTHSPQDFYAPD